MKGPFATQRNSASRDVSTPADSMSNPSFERLLQDWPQLGKNQRRQWCRRLIYHHDPGWLSLCRYLVSPRASDGEWRTAEDILQYLHKLDEVDATTTKYELPFPENNISLPRWRHDVKASYLSLALECADLVRKHKNLLKQPDDFLRREDLRDAASAIAEKLNLAAAMAFDFVHALLKADASNAAPFPHPVQADASATCTIPFLQSKTDEDHAGRWSRIGYLCTLSVEAVRSEPGESGGRIYPDWRIAFVTLLKDFGEQIELAEKYVRKHYGWPAHHDLRWRLSPQDLKFLPELLYGPSAGMAFAFLFERVAKKVPITKAATDSAQASSQNPSQTAMRNQRELAAMKQSPASNIRAR